LSGIADLNVLLADDNANMRSIICAILRSIGVEHLREARNGEEALAALREWPADVALIDFSMEPMNGVELTHAVRRAKAPANPYLPIIMLTGHADRRRVLEARDAGVSELIVKPVTAKALIGRLNNVIMRPRDFVGTENYFGPCRRRSNGQEYSGLERRNRGQITSIA
jgi:two-component system chemotaxis response regulator CheY